MSDPVTIAVYTQSLSGHRGEYLARVQQLFPTIRAAHTYQLLTPKPLLFLMIEDNFLLFLLTALLRAVLGNRTVGFLFRPLPAANGTNSRLTIKRYCLALLRRIDAIHVLSIIPTPLAPQITPLCDGWIYDLQYWDLDRAVKEPKQKKSARTITAIGQQTRSKGFETLAKTVFRSEQYKFRSAGAIDADLNESKALLEAAGGTIIDEYLKPTTLIEEYLNADIIWCAYAPDYDQSSGILGRAMQLGKDVIVREGSTSHRFCVAHGMTHLAITDAQDARAQLTNNAWVNTDEKITDRSILMMHSMDVLSNSLGISQTTDIVKCPS